MKKLTAALLAILLLISFTMPVWAENVGSEYTGEDFFFDIPGVILYDLATTAGNDPTWGLVGVTDGSTQAEENQSYGVIADLYSQGGTMNIKVTSRTNDTSMEIHNLNDLSEAERAEFLENLITTQSDEVQIQREYVEINGQLFFHVQTDINSELRGIAHEVIYGTIFNGHTLNFTIYAGDADLSPELEDLLVEVVNSVQVTKTLTREEVQERNAPEPIDPAKIVPMLIVLFFLLIVVLAPVVYIPVKKRLDKKRKAQMAALLNEHERTHKGNDWNAGEMRFLNYTDCTKEAIHTFSLYHAYVKQLGSLLLGAFLCIAILITVFAFNMEWWLKLAALAVTVYFAYKAIAMPTTIERIQRKVFSQGISSKAQYAFYEDGFRVSGITSGTLFPYFRIVAVRKHGRYLYLYYEQDNAYLVDQNGFTMGDAQAFEQFIREKTQKKGN